MRPVLSAPCAAALLLLAGPASGHGGESGEAVKPRASPHHLRVMTFNIYRCGSYVYDGRNKVIKHIEAVDADVVMLQEVNYNDEYCFGNLSLALGPKWHGVMRRRSYFPDDAIFSKWPIYGETFAQTEYGVGVKILYFAAETGRYVNMTVWSVHLDWRSSGNKAACEKLVVDDLAFYAGELDSYSGAQGRAQNARRIARHDTFLTAVERAARPAASNEPLILAGDFNAPSHLDWVPAMKEAHCGWDGFEWPASKTFEGVGMKDAFREVHPDPTVAPGITWSSVNKYNWPGFGGTIPNPQDRIDLVLYKSAILRPVRAQTYTGGEPLLYIPNDYYNDYPSDHKAVVVDFEIDLAASGDESFVHRNNYFEYDLK